VIAEREQVGENYVNQVRKRARDRGLLVVAPRVNWRTVPVPAAAQAAFTREAERRGVAVDTLIGALLTAIAEDDLFAAVLDTAER
jgi:hypothetical protein